MHGSVSGSGCNSSGRLGKPDPFQARLLFGSIERSLKTMPGCAAFQSHEDRRTTFQAWEGSQGLEREFG